MWPWEAVKIIYYSKRGSIKSAPEKDWEDNRKHVLWEPAQDELSQFDLERVPCQPHALKLKDSPTSPTPLH